MPFPVIPSMRGNPRETTGQGMFHPNGTSRVDRRRRAVPTDAGEPNAVKTRTAHDTRPRPVGILRRLAAIAYDAFLLFALFFVATALVLPFTGGEAIAPGNAIYLLYLLGVSYLYFGWCWTHGGQTLGMRAWHVRVRTLQGEAVPWRLGAARFLAALLSWGAGGAGFLWATVDPERRSWHDRLSHTMLETVE